MSSDVGIVCGACDWWNPRNASTCAHCGGGLALAPASASVTEAEAVVAGPGRVDAEAETPPPEATLGPAAEMTVADRVEPEGEEEQGAAPEAVDLGALASVDSVVLEPTLPALRMPSEAGPARGAEAAGLGKPGRRFDPPPEGSGVTLVRPVIIGPPGGNNEEELPMEQARHYICKSCYSPIPGGHKFCGKCGAPTNFTEESTTTQYFGAMQVPGKAKLILIRGEGLDGISYHLNSTEHVAGRQQGAILFPDDAWLSPRHANFFYRDGKLFVRDEDSINGVYCRITGPTPLPYGSMFLCGEQVFRVERATPVAEGPEADGTYFYASPSKPWSFKVIQVLRGGIPGMTVHDDGGQLVIGREDCAMNFPTDLYLDPKHVKLQQEGGQVVLTDLGTMNGTFLRIGQEKELGHGDYVFVGKQLLRVEVTP